MICGNCGFENFDDAVFCENCGRSLTQHGNTIEKIRKGSVVKLKKKKYIIPIVIIIAVVIASTSFLLSGGGYRKTVHSFFDAIVSADAENVLGLIPREKILYEMRVSGSDKSLSEVASSMEKDLKDFRSSLDDIYVYDEDDIGEYSAYITDTDNITGSNLNYVKYEYESAGVSVSAAKNVEVQFIHKVDGRIEYGGETFTIPVIKVGRSWYIDIENMEINFLEYYL